MPLSATGDRVLSSMQQTYGRDHGERVFYASINKGKPGSQKWEGAPAKRSVTPARRSLSSRTR